MFINARISLKDNSYLSNSREMKHSSLDEEEKKAKRMAYLVFILGGVAGLLLFLALNYY
jgi:hypothetical protein